MKRFWLLFILMAMIAAGYAQSVPEGSITGITGLSEDQKELDRLLAIAASGIQNPDLCYNIGVCQNQLGHPGLAALYYLKALNLNSAHQDARHNLRLVTSLSQMESLDNSHPFLIQLFFDVLAWLNFSRLALFILVFLLLSVVCAHWLIFLPKDEEKGPPVLLLSLSALILISFAGILVLKLSSIQRDARAVVTVPLAEVYQDDAAKQALAPLPEASIVSVLSQKRELLQIRLEDGTTLWIKGTDLTKINDI